MSNVINIFNSASDQLRAIADEIEQSGSKEGVTVIWGTNVYYCKDKVSGAEAASDTIWNCTYAIHKLMSATNAETSN